MRKCKGGEEPGPPEVPVSPCRSAGSLPLAGRRLGGEKARRREQERGGGGTGRGSWRGGQPAGEGGLKQRAANHPGGIPSSGNQGQRERAPEASLPPASPQWCSRLAASSLPAPRRRGPRPSATVFWVTAGEGSARQWALFHSWRERMPGEWWNLAGSSARGARSMLLRPGKSPL